MKKIIYSILLFVLISSCNDRFNDSDTYIHNGLKVDKNWKPITGIVFDVYPNDSIKFEIEYLNGELNGVYKEFYENGQLKKEGNFVSGQREGSYKGFIDDGRLIIEGYYKNDLKDSMWNKYCFNFSEKDLKTQLKYKYVYKDNIGKFVSYNEGVKGIRTNFNVSGDIFYDEYRSWRIGDSLRIDYIVDSIANKKWEVLFKKYYNTRGIGKQIDSLSNFYILLKDDKFNFNDTFSYKEKYIDQLNPHPPALDHYNNKNYQIFEIFPLKLFDYINKTFKYFSQDGTLLFSSTNGVDIIVENSIYSESISQTGVVYDLDDCSFCSDLYPKKYLLKLEENLPCEKVLYYLDIIEELEEL